MYTYFDVCEVVCGATDCNTPSLTVSLQLFELLGPEGLEMISTLLQQRAAIVDSLLPTPNDRTCYPTGEIIRCNQGHLHDNTNFTYSVVQQLCPHHQSIFVSFCWFVFSSLFMRTNCCMSSNSFVSGPVRDLVQLSVVSTPKEVTPNYVFRILKPLSLHRTEFQFNSVYLYSAKLQQLSSQGTLNNMVQFKPIGIQFIVIIIQ